MVWSPSSNDAFPRQVLWTDTNILLKLDEDMHAGCNLVEASLLDSNVFLNLQVLTLSSLQVLVDGWGG